MKKLTPYKVNASILEEILYSKIFYLDKSDYEDPDEIEDALNDMALESWGSQSEEWNFYFKHIVEGVQFYEIEELT